MGDLEGQVAVVTGAATGLGRAIASALSEAGVRVAMADIVEEDVERAAEEVTAEGGTAIGVAVDVRDEDAVAALGARATEELGGLSIWVNNAGIVRPAMLHKMQLEEFQQVLAVHGTGTFLGIREAARCMMASKTQGTILNLTSSAGLQGTIGQINYSAAKGAITAMTKSAARELARHGIRVNAVAPVAATAMTETIRTDEGLRERYLKRIPLRRFASPEEIAGTFRFLCSPSASYMTGQVVCVDGGLYMAS